MSSDCGLGSCFRPRWLNRFATPRMFLIIYGLLGTTQTMALIYFVATLTTLEKRFKIPSKTTGIVMSGNEISQIMLSLFLSYYGGRGNRPLWISCGVAFSAISCFILALPHYIYGAGQDALVLTQEYLDISKLVNASFTDEVSPLCRSSEQAPEVCSEDEYTLAPVIIVFMSQFVLGIGTTLYFALGQTYLDDNTKKTQTPMLLGLVLSLRSVGPAVGFVLGFACLSIYIDPSLTPVIGKKDPRWLGAWWLGWIILGVTMLLFSFLIAMFPKKLPVKKKSKAVRSPSKAQGPITESQNKEEQPLTKYLLDDFIPIAPPLNQEEEKKPAAPSNFSTALIRLLKNKLLMMNNIAAVFYILGASGYFTFLTKYMETQFQQSAAGANIVAGTAGIMAMVGGFLVSGIVISKVKPAPRKLLAWNVIVGFGYVIGEISFIFLGCPGKELHGTAMINGSMSLLSSCNADCNCGHMKYTPVCYEEYHQTFYSSCHAGCTTSWEVDNTTKIFGNCSCISGNTSFGEVAQDFASATVTSGPCFVDCGTAFYWFLGITCLMHALGSSGKIGNILVNYRSVIPEDKPFAQGLGLLMLSLFAFIPGPIIYGAIIDSTCLVWNDSCGNRGNCWLYHKDDFRYYLNSTAAGFTFIGVLFDIMVWYLGKGLNLYDEPDEENK